MLFTVGGHRVFVTHGNEVDEWNVVDADQLVWAIDRRLRGLPFDAVRWKPNAGTRLVLEVMNGLKARYPFVDLLKPEMGLAVPLLVALDREALSQLPGVTASYSQAASTQPRRLALLGEDRRAGTSKDLLSEALSRAMVADTQTDYLLAAELRARAGTAGGSESGTLGGGVGRISSAVLVWNLQKAVLDWLGTEEDTFNPEKPSEMDQKLIDRIGPGIAVVIAGHTHLPRSFRPGNRNLLYLNTGTWARVIELQPAQVRDPEYWKLVETAMREGTMAALDAPIPGGRPLARTTGLMAAVQTMVRDGRKVVEAGLVRVTDNAGESPRLTQIHRVGEVRP